MLTRRSMGLQPMQGQNNLRLNNTTKFLYNLNNIKNRKKTLNNNNKHTILPYSLSTGDLDKFNKPSKIPRPNYLFKIRNRINRHRENAMKIAEHVKRVDLRNSFPIVSNMPLINLNSSLVVVNNSPFALTDSRFGILHHSSPSFSYL